MVFSAAGFGRDMADSGERFASLPAGRMPTARRRPVTEIASGLRSATHFGAGAFGLECRPGAVRRRANPTREGRMDFNKLIARVKAILMTPKTEWPVIAAE